MTTIDATQEGSAQELACELCGVRERISGDEVESGMQAVVLMERRAETGEPWQLCVFCQVAVSLLECGDDEELPRAGRAGWRREGRHYQGGSYGAAVSGDGKEAGVGELCQSCQHQEQAAVSAEHSAEAVFSAG